MRRRVGDMNITSAGNKVRWNMVHYDVQLIGGIILHQGKVAEMTTWAYLMRTYALMILAAK